jgi:hypothetical protein
VEDTAVVNERRRLDLGRDHGDVSAQAQLRADAPTARGDGAKPAPSVFRPPRLTVVGSLQRLSQVACGQRLP